jgi:NMD protein affecting ribosome stability and mRNA decay
MAGKRTKTKATPNLRRMRRGNPGLQEEIHDPYRSTAKPRNPAACSDCGAIYRNGRWRWEQLRPAPPKTVCPACRRVQDRYPAGEILLQGPFVAQHADEVIQLVRNIERAENADHPLHRVMDVKRTRSGITITTTDIHLPRRIGHALEDAWRGDLTVHYDEAGHFTRVLWDRQD